MVQVITTRPCTSMKAVTIVPEKKYRIDLRELCECLKKREYRVKKVTPFLAIVSREFEVSIFPSGRIIVRDTSDEKEALKIAREIYECIEDPGG
ncbi:hypothetical protein [Thermococcus sp. CX2]|uniref:hypothetical protein n=1 Tax=Thermococcus sp. CX2 TaxID=163006 RepID=UPI00352FF23D